MTQMNLLTRPERHTDIENKLMAKGGENSQSLELIGISRCKLVYIGWINDVLLWRKKMATHSIIHAWEIPWTEKPGRLESMGSQRVGHDLATKQHQQQKQCELHSRHER